MVNINAGYGSLNAFWLQRPTAWLTFYVTAASGANAQFLWELFPADDNGIVRVHSTIALALAQSVTGRGDVIVIAKDFSTSPTDAELSSAGTKWVDIVFADQKEWAEQIVMTSNRALAQTWSIDLFTVVGVVEIISIVWVVTTVVQTQANNTKLKTVSNAATTDVSAVLNITGAVEQSRLSITWMFANALINTAKGVPVARQGFSFVAQEGSIQLDCAASSTGHIRRSVVYKPLSQWARVLAA